MLWWVSVFFVLLVIGEYIASAIAAVFSIPLADADTIIARLLMFTFAGAAVCIALDVKEGIRAAYSKYAEKLGTDVEKDIDKTFLKQATTPPWKSWSRASDFKIHEVLRSRSKTPEFCIFDLHYREEVCGFKFSTIVTFFVVTMSDTAPAQVQEWMVPKGYRAVRSQGHLYVYRATSWFGGGDRLSIAAIPDVLRVAFTIASDVEALGESATVALKERITLAVDAASGLNEYRPYLLILAWALTALLLVKVNMPGRAFVDMLLIQAAFGCAVFGSVWRRDRNPTPILFLWLVSVAMFWMPPVAIVLLAFAACEATFGIRSIAAGMHVAGLLAVGVSLYGILHHNLAIAVAGGPLFLALGFVQDLFARSKRTKRNDRGRLEWQVKSGL